MIGPALLLAISIASVSPASGTAGTTVTVRGSGFAPGAQVWFAGVRAETTFGDANTLVATAPRFAPVSVDVSVDSSNDFTKTANGFTYADNGDFERLLLPIFTPPTTGAFGSQFVTSLSIWNTAGSDIDLFAFAPWPCNFIGECSPLPGPAPMTLKARQGAPASLFPAYDGDPGRLLYIPRGAFDRLAASLRAADISRSVQSFGTRIPIVPEREFRGDFLALVDVPSSGNFRETLRIYSLDAGTAVHVRLINNDSTQIVADFDTDLPDPADGFHPGYAQIGDLPMFDGGRIEITPNDGKRIWAFVSVTNNDTQEITVVAPH
ncbi:MAG TPA: IPT/TIG domain-containing protein [Thermoanaerobaculia bacterium]|nr:IPT/TIG domain-containing protein [Thermoanaerobaculia bacterium]